MKRPLFLLPLVAALCSISLPTQSADYHVVVPVPGKAASYASIKLELHPASLPAGFIGDAYAGFDFNTALRITGDPDLDLSQASWSRYSGNLPDGLTLSRDGSLYGTPDRIGNTSFQVLAKYKSKTAVGTYTVGVEAQTKIIDAGGTRYWEVGNFAQSCADYRNPTKPYQYTGAIGDGTYRISINGQAPFDVYCNMTHHGGGWTLVASQNEATPVAWIGGQSGNSFTLSSQQLPAHAQVAFGRSEMPVLDYVDWTYHTGNIDKTLVTSPSSGNTYLVHRNARAHYGSHAPDIGVYVTETVDGMANTLTFERDDGVMSHTWAFAPFATSSIFRGYAFNGGYYRAIKNTEDWMIWVR